jgi:uncharacterized repeat protein (TIGR02543 family)
VFILGNIRNLKVNDITIEELNIDAQVIDTLYIDGVIYFLTLVEPSILNFSKEYMSISFRLRNNDLNPTNVYYEVDEPLPNTEFVTLDSEEVSSLITISDISLNVDHTLYARSFKLGQFSDIVTTVDFRIVEISLDILKTLLLTLESTTDFRTPKNLDIAKDLSLTLDSTYKLTEHLDILKTLWLALDSTTDFRTPKNLDILKTLLLTLESTTDFRTPKNLDIAKDLGLALDSTYKLTEHLDILKTLLLTLESTTDFRTPENLDILKTLLLTLTSTTDFRTPENLDITKDLGLTLDSTYKLTEHLDILKTLWLALDSTTDFRTPKDIDILKTINLSLDAVTRFSQYFDLDILKTLWLTLEATTDFSTPDNLEILKTLLLTLESTTDFRTPKGLDINKTLGIALNATFVLEDIYLVTYYLNGGTNHASNPATFYADDLPIALGDPTKTGYTFNDWYTEAGFTNAISSLTEEQNYSLYAKFTANTYTVVFNANGGSGSMSNQSFTYDVYQNLRTNTFTRSGYAFIGWATSPSGSVVYDDAEYVRNLATGGTVNLYAKWEVIRTTTTPNITDYGVRLITGDLGNFNQFYWKVQNLDSLSAEIFSEHTDTDPDISRGTIASNAKTGEITYTTSTSTTSITVYAKAKAGVHNMSAIDSQVISI